MVLTVTGILSYFRANIGKIFACEPLDFSCYIATQQRKNTRKCMFSGAFYDVFFVTFFEKIRSGH